MTKLTWVKWEPAAFLNGVVGLNAAEIGVYSIILNLIYDTGGPIPDAVERIARRCGMRPTSCEKVLDALAAAGKIVREFGVISNARADTELKTRTKVVEKWKKNFTGGDSKVLDNPSKINDGDVPSGRPSAPPKRAVEKESVEKNKIPSPNGEGADAPMLFAVPEKQEAPDARVYRRGREVLGKNSGGVVTKLIRAKHGNLNLAMAALETAATKANPAEYIGGALKGASDESRMGAVEYRPL